MSDTWVRILRTVVQVITGGVLTGLVDQVVLDVPAGWAPYVALGFVIIVTATQNLAEEFGLLPSSRGGGAPVVE